METSSDNIIDTEDIDAGTKSFSATETKYSLVKHSIVKADIEELTQADVHDNHQDDDEEDDDKVLGRSKVTFTEQSSLVPDVGNDDTDQSPALELEEAAPLVSARAVSTPASESSPRPSENLERPTSSKSEGSSSVAENKLGK